MNEPYIRKSCEQFGVPANSRAEMSAIKAAIEDEAAETGLSATFIASIGLQESGLCVRAPTTRYSHANPGIYQTHAGEGSCNPEGGRPLVPCPEDTIRLMTREGARGTSSGDGLLQLFRKTRGDLTERYWKTARMYNSGTALERMEDGVATHSYVADVANRVVGNTFAVSGFDGRGGADMSMAPEAESGADEVASGDDDPDSKKGPFLAPAGEGRGNGFAVSKVLHGPQGQDVVAAAQTGEPCEKCSPRTAAKPEAPVRAVAQTQRADRSYLSAVKVPLDDERLWIVADKGTAGLNLGPGARADCPVYYRIAVAETCNEVAARFTTTYERMKVDNKKLGNDCNNLWAGSHYCMVPP
jgi:hypothetical protein